MDHSHTLTTRPPVGASSGSPRRLVIGRSMRLERDPLSADWTLNSGHGAITLSAVTAQLLLLASEPISSTELVGLALAQYPQQLTPLDLMGFIESALSQQWLEYT